MKTVLTLFATVFGIAGGYVPFLFGDKDFLDIWSILAGTVGGLFGIWLGVWVYKRVG